MKKPRNPSRQPRPNKYFLKNQYDGRRNRLVGMWYPFMDSFLSEYSTANRVVYWLNLLKYCSSNIAVVDQRTVEYACVVVA